MGTMEITQGRMSSVETFGRARTVAMTVALCTAALAIPEWAVQADHADQIRLLQARIPGPPWPSPTFGPVSELLPAALSYVVPDEHLNWAVRTAGAAALLSSLALLASRVLHRTAAVVIVVAAVAASQAPMLTSPTNDVMSAATLCLLLAVWRTGPPWAVGVAAAAFALSRPDTVATAAVMLAWWSWSQRDIVAPAVAAAVWGVVVAPGTLAIDGYWTWDGTSRTWFSFGQHVAATVGVQEWPGGPHPWNQWRDYMDVLFPGASSVGEAITMAPGIYLRFLVASVANGMMHAVALFGPLLLAMVEAPRRFRSSRSVAAALSLVGMVPFTLLAYPHIRHMVRWFPLAMLLAVAAAERSGRKGAWAIAGTSILWAALLHPATRFHV